MRQPDKKTIRILCVCGWGVGSSMMLKMLMDDVISDLNLDLNFEIQHTDFTAAKGIIDQVAVVVGQEMHTQPFSQQVPIVITAENFVDSDPLKQQLVAGLKKQGWL